VFDPQAMTMCGGVSVICRGVSFLGTVGAMPAELKNRMTDNRTWFSILLARVSSSLPHSFLSVVQVLDLLCTHSFECNMGALNNVQDVRFKGKYLDVHQSGKIIVQSLHQTVRHRGLLIRCTTRCFTGAR